MTAKPEFAAFRRGLANPDPVQLTGWDKDRGKIVSKLRTVIRQERIQAQFRKYYVVQRIKQ